jgi:hypothetical protein
LRIIFPVRETAYRADGKTSRVRLWYLAALRSLYPNPSALIGILSSLIILGCSSLGEGMSDENLVVNPDFESGAPGKEAPG